MLYILTALLFYILGRYSGHEKEVLSQTAKSLKSRIHKSQAGVIDYPTHEQLLYRGSEQEKIDQEMIKNFKKAGL